MTGSTQHERWTANKEKGHNTMSDKDKPDAQRYRRDVYTLRVETTNAAFDGPEGRHELAAVLEKAADRIKLADFEHIGHPEGWRTNYPSIHKDINGNTCATATFTTEKERERQHDKDNLLAAALAVLLLDTITRATLEAIDPAATRQAVEAMADYGGRNGDFIAQFKPPAVLRAAIEDRLIEAKIVTGTAKG